nr:hypothetical protein [Bacillus wiedmannii]
METCKSGSERSIWKPIAETWKGAGCLLYTYAKKVNEKTKLIEELLRNVQAPSK